MSLVKVLLCFVLVLQFDSALSNQVFEGDELPKTLSFQLDFGGNQALLIRASQYHANYSISLHKDQTDQRKTSDFPSHMGLDEVLFVDRSECNECWVTIEGVDILDKTSPYRVTVQSITELLGKSTDTRLTSQVLKHISNSSNEVFLAQEELSNKENSHFKSAVEELRLVLNTANIDALTEWRHTALIYLADIYAHSGMIEESVHTMELVLTETVDLPSVHRGLALLELAPEQSDIKVQREYYDEILKISEKTENPRLYALAANRKAINLVRDGKSLEAIDLLDIAYEIHKKDRRFRSLLSIVHNLAWANQRANNIPKALRFATEQKLMAEQYREEVQVAWALYNFGIAYGAADQRYLADKFLDQALNRIENSSREKMSSAAALKGYILQEKANRLKQFHEFELAEVAAKEMQQLFDSLGLPGRESDADFLLGEIAFAAGDDITAKKYFNESLEYDRTNKRGRSEGKRSLRLAELALREDDVLGAASYLLAALRLLAKTEDYNSLSQALSFSVHYLYALGDHKKAETVALKAKNLVRRYGEAHEHALFLYRSAQVAFALESGEKASEMLNQARTIIDQTLPKVRRKDLQQTYLALQKSVFELNIASLLKSQADQPEQAILIAESFKARTLAERIRRISTDQFLSKEQNINRQVIHEQLLDNAFTLHANVTADVEALLLSTHTLSLQLENLEQEIIEQKDDREKMVSLPDSNPKLPIAAQGELIAYYFIGDQASWLWVITEQKLSVFQLPKAELIATAVDPLASIFSTPPAARHGMGAWEQNQRLHNLSELLLSPLLPIIEGSDITKITIIPDGVLTGVPFAALQTRDMARPLGIAYSINNAPSISSIEAIKERALSRSKTLLPTALVIADPVNTVGSGLDLERLPNSSVEADIIKSYLGTRAKIFKTEFAKKDDFINELDNSYSIIHIATHGLLNGREPTLSGVVFSGSSAKDSLWLTPEISAKTINSDLVFLSACDSSSGKYIEGEGLASLGRAFIESGANRVIGTLWKVQDKATSELVRKFYQQFLGEKRNAADSLRKARAEIYFNKINDWSDPYYWAGFQLQGGFDDV